MAKVKAKGSIVLEIVIVILVVALIGTIMYPKSVWEKTERNTDNCRKNMDRILKAELIYLKYHNNYEDTLDNVISFIVNGDSTGSKIREYVYSDTALADQILKNITEADSVAELKVETFLADTVLFVVLETTKYDSNLAKVILNRLEKTSIGELVTAARDTSDSSNVFILAEISKNVSVFDIVTTLEEDDSLKLVLERIRPEITIAALVDTLYKNQNWAGQIDDEVEKSLELIRFCPHNNKPYNITAIDTSVIKIVNISCPIDSIEIEDSKNEFVTYHLGHLRLDNHGKIMGGEKSWLKD